MDASVSVAPTQKIERSKFVTWCLTEIGPILDGRERQQCRL